MFGKDLQLHPRLWLSVACRAAQMFVLPCRRAPKYRQFRQLHRTAKNRPGITEGTNMSMRSFAFCHPEAHCRCSLGVRQFKWALSMEHYPVAVLFERPLSELK